MKMTLLKGITVTLSLLIFFSYVSLAQGDGGMSSPQPSETIMKSCGDYIFVLRGATLSCYNSANHQPAETISLLDDQTMEELPLSPRLLIPARGNGKPDCLLVLLGNRLFVVKPAEFTKFKTIVLPESQEQGKAGRGDDEMAEGSFNRPHPAALPGEPKGHLSSPSSGKEPPLGPRQKPGMEEFAFDPDPEQLPSPLMDCEEMSDYLFGPGPEPMPMPFESTEMPVTPPLQMELKGQKLFLLQGCQLLVIDYQSGNVNTVTLPEPAKKEKTGK